MLKFILIYLFLVNLCSVIAKSNFPIQYGRSAKDLPLREDLNTFLQPIEFLTKYMTNNVLDMNMDYALGIFFTNVHLKRVLLDKGQNFRNEILSRIKAIVDANEKSLSFFHKAAKNEVDFMTRDHAIIADLLVNSTYWVHRLNQMKYVTEPTYSYTDLETRYSIWKIYTDKVDNVYKWIPSPNNSDICLVTLSINPKYKGDSISWCPIAGICYPMLKDGTNFGYALCHRLVLLLMAHLGRGCYLTTDQEDEDMKQKFCSMAYAEAEYIAMNGYGIADLLLEIMCFCSLDGRLQFLRRTWLLKITSLRNKDGCFGPDNRVRTRNRRIQKTSCNSHTSSLASGTFAAAVRFILEEYY